MKKTKIKNLEQDNQSLNCFIEALEGAIENLEEVNRIKQSRIVELIHENDRLTLTYEPYNPAGSEGDGWGFYELLEENKELTHNILDKIEVIKELDAEVNNLQHQLWVASLPPVKTKKIKKPRRNFSAGISLDLWPARDWFRLRLDKWSPGRYFQICVGPIRIDIYEY